ncbi:MFS transporter [Lacticaseibacillus camelliae]|uniref:Uncharacterized protein n=2 Tax=Lacticaseibacillus camelliae TaxID=381742 RepID=A0A0R2ERY3_9LACO|nr:MFS transporter [Lacticaseibacillus camelliae]KRN19096.1 hypothetical protein FC75_GL000194 [Lacticaseibacillus camelliae DSM 22697 = JCM 13995]
MTENTSTQAPTPKRETRPRERITYWLYFTGQAMGYMTLTAFSTTYLMMNGVNVGAVATAMFIAKLWDVFADALFGVLYDKVHWRSGNKAIPWLRLASFTVPLTTLILFLIPSGLTPTMKLVWFVIAYIIWDTSYTMSDVPIYAMVTSMTTQVNERNSLLSMARLFALAGSFLVTVIGPVLVSERVGMTFPQMVAIIAVMTLVLMFPVSVFGKERIKPKAGSESHYHLKDIIHYLRTNKFLGIYYLGYLFWGLTQTDQVVSLFTAYCLFGTALFATLTTVLVAIPTIIFSPFMGRILKRIDKFKLFYYSMIALAVLAFAMYFVGYHNKTLYLIMVVLRAIPIGLIGVLGLTFTPDIVEYGEFKTHIDARGIAFAVQSFAAKLSSMNAPLGLAVLSWFGWKAITASSFAALEAENVTQSASALSGLWAVTALVPAIGAVLASIALSFYKLNDHDVQLMAKVNAGELDRATAQKQMKNKY